MDNDFAADVGGLNLAVRLLVDALAASDDAPPVPASGTLPLPTLLPETGRGGEATLRDLVDLALRGATNLGHPGFLAHMDPPTPWVTWAAALWAASRNQNLLHPETSPVARPLEDLVIRWLAPAFGMDGGHMVPGSSVATLTGLWAARELRGVTEVVCSERAHLSVRKAAHILGLTYRAVPADADHRLDRDKVGDLSRAALVLSAGTVAAGAIDPLTNWSLAAWRHVDAAWGGPLRLSESFAHRLDGIELADSVSVSAHKWLFQPKESALILFRDTPTAHNALSFGGGHLAAPNVGVLGSHGSAALPLVATLLAWGRKGVEERINHCMHISVELAERVSKEPELELFRQPTTGVVLWRRRGSDAATTRRRLTKAFVSLTEFQGERWLRSVAANPMADPNRVVDAVLEIAG